MEIILKYFTAFTPQQLRQLEMLNALYRDWNDKINVVSRKDIDSLYERHVLHSLAIAAAYEFQPAMDILDLGTGGGFPGIPLAIFFPETKFLLADSIAKKLKVINDIAEKAGLTNITTRHTRAEEIRDLKFDFVVSRAVAPLKELWQWSKPLLKKNFVENAGEPGVNRPGLICLKGGDLAQEIQESNTRPHLIEIKDIFDEAYFRDKYILYVPR